MNRKDIDLQFIIITALLIITAIASWNVFLKVYMQADTVSIHNFPRQIGEWDSVELPISEGDYQILETRNAFIRKYTHSSGEKVFLFIIYSQNNRKVSHPPEICYTGSGATILGNDPAVVNVASGDISKIDARKVVVERGNVQQVMYYWYKIGSSFTPNYWKQQMIVAINTLLKRPSSSALMRVSCTIDETVEEGEKQATDLIEEFTRLISPYLTTYLP